MYIKQTKSKMGAVVSSQKLCTAGYCHRCCVRRIIYIYLYIYIIYIYIDIIQARLAKNKKECWPAFVTRLLIPRSRKSGYGLLLGCRSPLDGEPFKKSFFDDFEPKKSGNLHRLFCFPIAIDRAWSNKSGESP